MKRAYNRSAICKRAHELKRQHPWSEAMRLAWAEAKSSGVVAIQPQRLPLEALVVDGWSLAKRIANGRIRAGIRVRVDYGVEIAPDGLETVAYGGTFEKVAIASYSKQKKIQRQISG